jgi:predicted RNase H-like HicB family nuclease
MHEYLIVVHADVEGGYWTEVPALPGCGSQGDTVDEAVEMTRDAITGFIASLKKHGQPVPTETSVAVKVTVAA